jgi:hypothetical protein
MADKANAKIVVGRGNGKGQQCLENLVKCVMARKDAEFIVIDEFFRLQNEKRFCLKCRENADD